MHVDCKWCRYLVNLFIFHYQFPINSRLSKKHDVLFLNLFVGFPQVNLNILRCFRAVISCTIQVSFGKYNNILTQDSVGPIIVNRLVKDTDRNNVRCILAGVVSYINAKSVMRIRNEVKKIFIHKLNTNFENFSKDVFIFFILIYGS